jgi:response regulator NasT
MSDPASKTYRLLVVEDERNVGTTLVERLQREGFRVDWVKSVAEAESALKQGVYDLALLDVGLPDGDGFQVAARVRETSKQTAVVFLTAYGNPEDRIRGLELGAEDYIVKPFREAELLPAIEIALARFAEFNTINKELGDLKDTMETRKLVERAKGVLMDTQGLKEQDAFRKIQQLSMNTRKSMREIAQAILLTAQIDK